jgi:hypothetical protein
MSGPQRIDRYYAPSSSKILTTNSHYEEKCTLSDLYLTDPQPPFLPLKTRVGADVGATNLTNSSSKINSSLVYSIVAPDGIRNDE